MSHLFEPRKSLALKAFLLELTELTQRYGFHISGSKDSEGWSSAPSVTGNGASFDLIYDGTEYDAV